jgi:hypothetical protein
VNRASASAVNDPRHGRVAADVSGGTGVDDLAALDDIEAVGDVVPRPSPG